ncbi:glutamine synthetase [Ameyamaea chiangmaiensis NBRC 103196]|uniref:Glutamine synthetase n=1 Tax=Ameyamaea chiangmaiensis TaxID=442969 RepID=A0A850PC43_9PROT|nr:glutamine synthetase family protein [Ameyamaea chiangmaiensis]MBS4075554.1 glutamine synthetase [Ameyamaea chiangmaiensis]NVN40239.1 glutamine synthetase [Ameyamaea chiangmaiensis]GBQ69332.1 glutamine synthetase [Ameyamaea chiangmaiensis NBRC 103196]
MTATSDEHLIFAGTSDLAGLVRGKGFPARDLDDRRATGVGYTASNIMLSAFGPIYKTPFGTTGDLMLVPDPAAGGPVPGEDNQTHMLMPGDIRHEDGSAWSCCPRHFLRRGLDALEQEFGLRMLSVFEQEFTYTGVADRPASSYAFDLFRRSGRFGPALMGALRAAGIEPDSFIAEAGDRQFEVTVCPRLGLASADETVLLREIVRGCAASLGHRASFTPINSPDGIGNGTHIHFSFRDLSGQPVTYDPNGPFGLSPQAAAFAAGIVRHMPAMTALTAPSVASYYRLRPSKWAPTRADIALADRGASLRVCPTFSTDPDVIARRANLEFRVVDAAASPYIALGCLVHAGLEGLRHGLVLPAAGSGDAPPLPSSLAEALSLMAADPAPRAWMGQTMFDAYTMLKTSEIEVLSGLSEDEICRRYAEVY